MALNFYKIMRGLFLTPQSTSPVSPQDGDLYYDSAANRFQFRENGAWQGLGSGGGSKNYLAPIITSLSSGVKNPGNGDFELGTAAGWSTAGVGFFSGGVSDANIPMVPGMVYASGYYIFRVGSASATVGATYTVSGNTYTVAATIAAGPYLVCTGSVTPPATGTLVLSSGTGDSNIIYAQRVNTTTTNMTMGAVTSGQLAGSASGQWVASAATTSGNGVISDAFFIDKEDQGKVLTFSFFYQFTSGASNVTLSGDSNSNLGIYIYDVDNGAWILPTEGAYGFTDGAGVGKVVGKFSASPTGTRYQLFFGSRGGSTGAFTVLVDDFQVGPEVALITAAVGEWQDYTPTLTNAGNATAPFFQWRRVGSAIDIRGRVTIGSSLPTGSMFVSLPPGLSIKSTIPSGAFLGYATGSSPSPFFPIGTVQCQSATTFGILTVGANANWNATNPATWQSGDYFWVNISGLPIEGFTTNVTLTNARTYWLSSIPWTRVTGSGPSALGQYRSYLRQASTGSFSETNGTPGVLPLANSGFRLYSGNGWASNDTNNNPTAYVIFVGYNKSVQVMGFNGTDHTQGVTLDCSYDVNFANGLGTQWSYSPSTGLLELNTFFNSATTATNRPGSRQNQTLTSIYIDALISEGPATMAVAPFVGAKYAVNTAQNGINGSSRINYDQKVYDTHNAVTTGIGAWQFVAPVSGYYRITAAIQVTAIAASTAVGIRLNVNGTPIATSDCPIDNSGARNSGNMSTEVYMSTGNILTPEVSTLDTSYNITGGLPTTSFITISKITN